MLGFGVAVNDRRKNQQTGEWEDYPNFIDCTMFGARAESRVAASFPRATRSSIEGKLRWSQWERDGQKRSKIEVIVDELEFMIQPQQRCPRTAAMPAAISAPTSGTGGGRSDGTMPLLRFYDEDISVLSRHERG